MRVYPSGGDVASACDATTPPAPGRFSTTTVWPQCRETTSPSVRVRMSTPPPAAYGTKICTGLDGNSDCADATPPAANIATAAAAIRNHLPMAALPILLLRLLLQVSIAMASPSGAGHGNCQGMLTIPRIASSFGASTRRPRSCCKPRPSRNKGEFDGGCRGTNLAQGPGREGLAREGIS